MPSCSCPAKVMLAGEYVVIDGAPAVLMAVNRRAVATVTDTKQRLSPFLVAVHEVLAREYGDASEEARAALRTQVDTSAFSHEGQKLGLGSSAAAVVATIGAAIAVNRQALDIAVVHRLATLAHAAAQERLGARGSGADIACATLGGTLRFQLREGPQKEGQAGTVSLSLPTGLHLVFPFTGSSASTATLVGAVRSFKEQSPAAYHVLSEELSKSSRALVAATSAAQALDAIEQGGRAVATLGQSARVPLWLPVHGQLSQIAQAYGGVLKPTGAGGGDLALAAFANLDAAEAFRRALADLEILCPPLAVEREGVRLQV